MTELHQTPMGHRLIEHTLPELVRQVSRLAAAVERLADLHERAGSQQQPKTEKTHDPEDDRSQEDPPHR